MGLFTYLDGVLHGMRIVCCIDIIVKIYLQLRNKIYQTGIMCLLCF